MKAPGDTDLERLVIDCWPRACAHWPEVSPLQPPAKLPETSQILGLTDLAMRQVYLNHDLVRHKQLLGCVEAILAHQVGHLAHYPGALAVQARLRLLEKTLLPLEDCSVLHLFNDLLVNAALGNALRDQLVQIGEAFCDEAGRERDAGLLFSLAVHEELWQTEPGALMGPGRRSLEANFPHYRAEAHLLAQDLFGLGPNLYTQFLRFVSVLSRYVQPHDGSPACLRTEPAAQDWADALMPAAAEKEAITRALAEHWLHPEQARRLTGDDLEGRVLSLPGASSEDATLVPEVMAAYYRREAENCLLRVPPQRTLGEATLPTTLEEWEPGDPVSDIDWLATLTERGPALGAAGPLRRLRTAETEGHETALWRPRLEIYLDVSGSMPDPRWHRNALTLAAQVLVTATIRAGGSARAVLYSNAPVVYRPWCRSEAELSRFLMHYIGAGTTFPFDVLRQSVEECKSAQPIRVAITDTDFDDNYDARPENAGLFAEAVAGSPHFVLLLYRPDADRIARYRKAGATVVAVDETEDFPRLATDLAHALFEDRHVDP
jgi:hypothetical protein